MSFLKNIQATSQSDAELVLLYKKTEDLKLLGALYQRYMDLVYGVCLKYLKAAEPAKDSVMAIFEELIVKLKKHEVENFRGWLYQLAKNHCLMQLRTPKNLKTVNIDPSLMQSGENVHLNGELSERSQAEEKEESFLRMEQCLETLSPDQQQMIRLFYLESKCYNEIVEITGQSWNQVRSCIQNGRRNLKNCMENRKLEVENRKLL